ncbi:MAG: hypothetical protein HYX75_02925 [Acidobacteria bacterium]|nr:hypothetical protein [Acidobacteriota bacterium]
MSGDYLWDGSGEPDPEVQRLEEILREFRHTGPAPDFAKATAPAPHEGDRMRFGGRRRPALIALAAAACVGIAAVGIWYFFAPRPGYEVASLAGIPLVNTRPLPQTHPGHLPVGGWLETDAVSRARISVGMIGEVEVEPNTRIGLLKAHATEHRLSLQRGKMQARIWAPPLLFLVDTPSAVAVDLGCAYTLETDSSGTGMLRVTSGWVAFERDGIESFVPAGARCSTRAGHGPGTPVREDSTEALTNALVVLDFDDRSATGRAEALETVLAEARLEDAFTLWHLLARSDAPERGRIFDRLSALVPPPPGVTREGTIGGDARMRDLWWNEFGLGNTGWWRVWKGPTPATTDQE